MMEYDTSLKPALSAYSLYEVNAPDERHFVALQSLRVRTMKVYYIGKNQSAKGSFHVRVYYDVLLQRDAYLSYIVQVLHLPNL